MFVFFSVMSTVEIGTFICTISSVIIASAPGLPLASISWRSLALPATTFRGSLSSFKGSSHMKWQLCIMPFAPSTTQFWFQFCQTMSLLVVHFQVCWFFIAVTGLFKDIYIFFQYFGGWQPCQLCRCVLVASTGQYEMDF